MQEIVHDDSLRRLAYDLIRRARARWFTVQTGGPRLTADADAGTVTRTLADAGYSPNWLFSYNYEGEDANLVRFHHDPAGYPDLPYRQDHVRLFVDETPAGQTGLRCHTEANALVHRDSHLEGDTLQIRPARRRVTRILESADVTVREDE